MNGLLASSLKIVMVGATSVGKTAISLQFIRHHFVSEYDPTIEDSYRKQLELDGQTLIVEVLDTAGQEEFRSMREQWIRQGQAFFIVYSITSRSSIAEAVNVKKDIERIRDASIHTFPTLLFGNKTDLSSLREVKTEEVIDLAKQFSCSWMEGSAMLNENIEIAYEKLLRSIKTHIKELSFTPRLPYGNNTNIPPPITPHHKRKFYCQLL